MHIKKKNWKCVIKRIFGSFIMANSIAITKYGDYTAPFVMYDDIFQSCFSASHN
jgi:hypothetical protein